MRLVDWDEAKTDGVPRGRGQKDSKYIDAGMYTYKRQNLDRLC